MKKRKGSMTAAGFMAKLEADPDYQRRMAEKRQRHAEHEARLDAITKPILDDLRSMGVATDSIEEMLRRCAPLPPQIVQILLGWLPRIQEDRVKESLIRALGAAKEPFDGRPLVDCFLHDKLGTLRFPIANTIVEARPFGIADWVAEVVKGGRFGDARGMLALALARLVPAEASLPVLRAALADIPGYAAMGLAEVGGAAELEALRVRVGSIRGWEKVEVRKAIRRIEERLEKARAAG